MGLMIQKKPEYHEETSLDPGINSVDLISFHICLVFTVSIPSMRAMQVYIKSCKLIYM